MSVADMLGIGPKREVTDNFDGTWTIRVTPQKQWAGTNETKEVKLTTSQYGRYKVWRAGKAMIQEALPDLSDADCDILMMGFVE